VALDEHRVEVAGEAAFLDEVADDFVDPAVVVDRPGQDERIALARPGLRRARQRALRRSPLEIAALPARAAFCRARLGRLGRMKSSNPCLASVCSSIALRKNCPTSFSTSGWAPLR